MASVPKVRESCDQCSHQKVKCGKQRPRCARCVSKGLECCNYSLSMRIGRPPRPKPHDALESKPSIPDPSSQSYNFHGAEWATDDTSMLLDDESWNMTHDMLTASTMPVSIAGSPRGSMFRTSSASDDLSVSSSLEQQFTPAPVVPAMAPQSTFCLSPDMSSTDGTHTMSTRSQDCLGNIIKLLDDMHVRNPLCAGNATQAPATERTIDLVLRYNRDCVYAVRNALSCPCLAQPSVLLSVYLLLSTVVSWYGAIIGMGARTSESPAFTPLSRYIAPSPLFMGSYELSAEAKRSIRARVVLTELKTHVEPLLLRLPQFYASCSAGDPLYTGDSKLGAMSSIRTPLDVQKCILREQLRLLMLEAGQTT